MKYNRYEKETVISIEISENRQCQISYNMGGKDAMIDNLGVDSIDSRMKRFKVIPISTENGLFSYIIPKRWVRILRSRAKVQGIKNTWIMTRMPSVQNKMANWKVKPSNEQGGYLIYNVPKNWIRLKKPRILSEKQIEQLKIIRRHAFAQGFEQ
jgi:hypothetical protein